MIYGKFVSWILRITHIPTGISVQTDSSAVRRESLHAARERSMTRLKSKLWAANNLPPPSLDTAFTYDFERAGLGPYPDDLDVAKKRITHPKD